MTTLMSWVSFTDTGEAPHLPRAVYLASDSKITWGSDDLRWEAGRKLFAAATEPHVFGYCGDVVLPALILGQIVSAIDAGILFDRSTPAADRHEIILRTIETGVSRAIATPTLDFTIHHLVRDRDWPETSFRAWNIAFDAASRTIRSTEIPIPVTTKVIRLFGSGIDAAQSHHLDWETSDAAGRSRALLASFCDSIKSGDDPLSGGPPQLVALYTKKAPIQIGMYVDERRFLNGLEIGPAERLRHIPWRNELGEDVDPMTGKAVPGARRFHRPKKLAQK